MVLWTEHGAAADAFDEVYMHYDAAIGVSATEGLQVCGHCSNASSRTDAGA